MVGELIVRGGDLVLDLSAKQQLGFDAEKGRYSRKGEFVARRSGFYSELISRKWGYGKGYSSCGRLTGQDHATIIHCCKESTAGYYRNNMTEDYAIGVKLALDLFPAMSETHADLLTDSVGEGIDNQFNAFALKFGRAKALKVLTKLIGTYNYLYGNVALGEIIQEIEIENQIKSNEDDGN